MLIVDDRARGEMQEIDEPEKVALHEMKTLGCMRGCAEGDAWICSLVYPTEGVYC